MFVSALLSERGKLDGLVVSRLTAGPMNRNGVTYKWLSESLYSGLRPRPRSADHES